MIQTIRQGKWAGRFIWASVLEGLGAVTWTLFIITPWIVPAPSRVIAGGGAGTWLFVGYSLYLLVGVVAVAVTSIFYVYIEGIQGKTYSGIPNYLAWAQILLMNVGVVGATWLMMYAGFTGGAASLPTSVGGQGLNPGQVHLTILQYYPEPIFYFLVLAVLGVLSGGLGYILASRKS